MDSKVVTRALKAIIHPALKAAQFTNKGRNYWRPTPHVTQVLNIQSFNSYTAEVIGCSTYSFTLNAGVFYPSSLWLLPTPTPPPTNPQIWLCQAQRRVLKTVAQRELARRDIWHVRPDGSNLDAVVEDAWAGIRKQALPWLETFSNIEHALNVFRTQDGSEHEYLSGARVSPARRDITSALERQLDAIRHGGERGHEPS